MTSLFQDHFENSDFLFYRFKNSVRYLCLTHVLDIHLHNVKCVSKVNDANYIFGENYIYSTTTVAP